MPGSCIDIIADNTNISVALRLLVVAGSKVAFEHLQGDKPYLKCACVRHK